MARRMLSSPPVLAGFSYVRPLGSGGFADVFLYEQDMPRRQVAVKVLPDDAHDPAVRRMFNAEADVLAQLSAHPSIVTVYQASISADGRPYIAMEYCPGSLSDRYRVERLPVEDVLSTAVRLAGALESAHHAGLIHRDIKPSNILVTTFGAAVLADFGISASLRMRRSDDLLAMSVPWSAPEVVNQQTSGTVASEVWALGATVYSLLAGHSPFERRERDQNSRDHLVRRITRATYTPIERVDVPAEMQTVLATAMARHPERRYRSSREFGEAVREVQRAAGYALTPLEVPTEQWRPAEVTFSDDSERGVVRSQVQQPDARRPRPAAKRPLLDEDAAVTADPDRRRRVWPWIVAGIVGAGAVGAVIVQALGAF